MFGSFSVKKFSVTLSFQSALQFRPYIYLIDIIYMSYSLLKLLVGDREMILEVQFIVQIAEFEVQTVNRSRPK